MVHTTQQGAQATRKLAEITIRTEHDEDMGTVTIRMRGECITSFHFSVPWPKDAYHSGTYWLPKQCRIALAGRPTPFQHILDVPSTDAVYLTLSKKKWESIKKELCLQNSKQYWTAIIASQKAGRSSAGTKGAPSTSRSSERGSSFIRLHKAPL